MKLKLLLCLSVAALAQTISYTGISDVSQKAAEEEAAAGVAKQISATVTSSTTVRRGETRVGDKTELTKDMHVQNMVKSNLFLKGLKFSTEPKQGGKFVSVATLDLNELTSAARLQLSNIQKKVSEKESLASAAIQKKKYAEAVRLLSEAETEARPYQSFVDEIAVYMPVDESFALKSNASKIQSAMVDSLRGTKIVLPTEKLLVDGETPLVFQLKAVKNGAPSTQFPIIVEHKGRRLAEAFTDETGVVSFRIPSMVLQSEPYVLNVVAGVNLQYRNEAGLVAQDLEYSINRPQCKFKLVCREKAAVCGEVSQKLGERLGFMVESDKVTPIEVGVQTELKRTVKQLSSYDVTLTLKKGEYSCSLTGVGAAKNESDAVRNAVSKMNFSSCNAVQKFCEE